MIAVGVSTRTDAREQSQSVILITDAHIVQAGTMAFSIAGKDRINTKGALEAPVKMEMVVTTVQEMGRNKVTLLTI